MLLMSEIRSGRMDTEAGIRDCQLIVVDLEHTNSSTVGRH